MEMERGGRWRWRGEGEGDGEGQEEGEGEGEGGRVNTQSAECVAAKLENFPNFSSLTRNKATR